MISKPLETIWSETSLRLKNFILRRVEDEETADDLLQEVFIRIHKNMTKLKDSEKFESWIFQIARNVVIDHYRSRRSFVELADTFPDQSETFVEEDAISELTGSIRELIETLPEQYREPLLMVEYQNVNQKELADRLGISLSGAKSRVQRARQKIKDELLSCCHFEFDRYGRVIDYWDLCCCCANLVV